MTDTVTPVAQDEAQALASANAGYARRKARASAAAPAPAAAPASAAEEVTPPAAPPLADPAHPSASGTEPEGTPEPNPPAEPAAPAPAEPAIAEELRALKAKVHEMAASGADAATVRKMHGDIGEITRLVKQLAQASTATAPATQDKLAAAMEKVKATAGEYPDIAGPFLEVIEELSARVKTQPAQPAEPQPAPQAAMAPTAPAVDLETERVIARQQAAIEALNELHPDRHEIRKSPEFKKWFSNWKTPADREKAETSWNPGVVAQPFSEFKAWREAQKRKSDRLEAAVQPTGTPQAPGPNTPSPTEQARRGYERYAGKRL